MKKKIFALAIIIFIGSFKFIPITYTLNQDDLMDPEGKQVKFNIAVLEFADSNDTVIINVNSNGGYMHIAVPLINAILLTDAHTKSYNKGRAYSAGALIAVATDEISTAPLSAYMFHRPYYDSPFRGQRALVPLDEIEIRVVHKYMNTFVFPLMTEEEFQGYMNGADIAIEGSELLDRIRKAG
jgi:ATP-dependent protease ClpP protease subunit